MSKTIERMLALRKEACEVAVRFVQDAGYEDCHIVPAHVLPDAVANLKSFAPGKARKGTPDEPADQVFYLYIEARKGPNATRKTPVEYFHVRVRVTGKYQRTLHPSFVTTPPEGEQ